MGVKSMKKLTIFLIVYFLFASGGCFAEKSLTLVLWDDAIIIDKFDQTKSVGRQFIYSSSVLRSGDKFTALVPVSPGYRVLCCVEVASGSSMEIEDLITEYAHDKFFVRRLKSIKGVRYAYLAKFSSEKEMTPAMRRLAKGSGDTYFSAPALLGAIGAEYLDKSSFRWAGWGMVTLTTELTKGGFERYQLDGLGKSISVSVESLPD
jgi:hypothetical protein